MNLFRMRGPITVPVERAREHAHKLKATMTKRDMSERSGIPQPTIDRILYGGTRRILKRNEQAILAVQPDPHSTAGMRDALPSARRIRALVAIGWTQRSIADQLGFDRKSINAITTYKRKRIWRKTADQIDNLYKQLHMTPGPSEQARKHARRNNWLPPLAWDNIDDLNERHRYHETVHASVKTLK